MIRGRIFAMNKIPGRKPDRAYPKLRLAPWQDVCEADVRKRKRMGSKRIYNWAKAEKLPFNFVPVLVED
jgi:hypothetical protein